MTDQDKEYLRDLLAGFASVRIGLDGTPEVMLASARRCYAFADAMIEAREPEETIGLPAIKRKAKA
jgi:hypothetical protein